MADEEIEPEPQSEAEEKVSLKETINAILDEADEIEAFQRRLADPLFHSPPSIPSPTALRKAKVLRHAVTILQLVELHSAAFKDAIRKSNRGRSGR